MKSKLGIATSAAILSFALQSTAADQPADRSTSTSTSTTTTEQRARVGNPERLTAPLKASDIIGKEVDNAQKEKLGKVNELIVDLQSGRVNLAIVSSGGILGVGARNVAVPPRAFSYDPDKKALRLDVDKEKFHAAPTFDMTRWDSSSSSNQLAETYRYYGQEMYPTPTTPYLSRDTNRTFGATSTSQFAKSERASKVIGMAVVNRDNKKIGDINELIVDLPAGRIVHVVVSSGGFLGIGDALNAVPPGAFHYVSSRDALQIDMTKEDLAKAPNFKSTDWPDFNDAAYSSKVYRSYGVEPYFDADNTKRNVRDRNDNSVTPIDQGTSDSDMQTTRRIRQEILKQDGMSVNARNVKIITSNGRVTLRGPVKDDTERRTIAEIAGRISNGQPVDNQLEVTKDQK